MFEQPIKIRNFAGLSRFYFDEIFYPAFTSIQKKSKPIRMVIKVAQTTIALYFYTQHLQDTLAQAITHLTDDTTSTQTNFDLEIHICDSKASGVTFTSPWEDSSYFFDSTERNTVSIDDFIGAYYVGESSMNFFDKQKRAAYFWVPDDRTIKEWIYGAPFRIILHWFLQERGIQLVHGASVGIDGTGVLISARGGSGKSTTALGSVLAGFDYIGDDYIALGMEGKTPMAYSLYNSIKFTEKSVQLLPALAPHMPHAQMRSDNKYILFLDQHNFSLTNQLQLKALFIPKIVDRPETTIVPARKVDALVALAPTTILQLSLNEQTKFQGLTTLVNSLPCFFLELGHDLNGVTQAIRSFLKAR